MALDIPHDRRLAGPTARLHLVEAILNASAHEPETYWLEWKKEADLGSKQWRGELASHVLGFANRDPRAAEGMFDGHGYLLVGVSPGSLQGVDPADPAELEDWLSRYLGGSDGPHWNPDYVPIDGKQVLLIDVEPPRQGDPIRTLRKGFTDPPGGTHPEGRIFVRRQGKTSSQPNVAEMQMLERRLTSKKRDLPLVVEASSSTTLAPLDLRDSARETLLRRLRNSMMASLRRYDAAGLVSDYSFIEDGRSPAEYRKEVDRYLSELSGQLDTRIAVAAMKSGLGSVRLSVVNDTDDNFSGVLVHLEIEGDARVHFSSEDLRMPANPRRPRAFGTPADPWGFQSVGVTSIPARRYFHKRTIQKLANDRIAVEFRPWHVRPHDREGLEALVVLPEASMAGGALKISWRATSDGAPGVASGEFELPVSAEPVDIDELDLELDPTD